MNPENIAKIGLVNLEMVQQNSLKNIYNGIRERAAVMRRLAASTVATCCVQTVRLRRR